MKKWLCFALVLCGCSSAVQPPTGGAKDSNTRTPVFTVAFSEYPSWSVFGVAHEKGLIDQREGKLGPIEKEWNVDIVLKFADYDTCLTLYSNKQVDAACLTNLDSIPSCVGRPSVIALPTSTSVGGDACITDNEVTNLKDVTTRGLEKSVSQYVFERGLELKKLNVADYKFMNMDPAAAAQAMQTKQPEIRSIMVWNPFALETLRHRTDTKVQFDSSVIPEEIVDCVVFGQDSLAKTGGREFACAVISAYYGVNRLLENPETKDDTLVAIGAKFSNLGLEDMKLVVTQTRFYKTPQEALTLLNDKKFQDDTMPRVLNFCRTHDMPVPEGKVVGFNDSKASLNFSTEYLEHYQKMQH